MADGVVAASSLNASWRSRPSWANQLVCGLFDFMTPQYTGFIAFWAVLDGKIGDMKLRHFAFFLILLLFGVFVVRSAGKLEQLIELLKSVNILVLLLIIPARYGYYWANTRYYDHFYKLFKRKVPFTQLFVSVMAMNFVNTVLPSAGISGATYFAHSLEEKVTARESYLAQFFWYIATFLSVAFVLGLSFIVLFFSSTIAQASFRVILVVTSIILGATILIMAVTLNQTIFEKVLYILTRPMNWLLKLLKRPPLGEVAISRFVESFQDLVHLFAANPKRAVRPLLDAFLCIVFEVLSITIVFLAFGELINPGIIGVAYIFALLFSVLSVFTAGVGVYEATMVAVMVGLGVRFDVAFSVTALYRIAALWLFIPVGFFFYQKLSLDKDRQESEPPAEQKKHKHVKERQL